MILFALVNTLSILATLAIISCSTVPKANDRPSVQVTNPGEIIQNHKSELEDAYARGVEDGIKIGLKMAESTQKTVPKCSQHEDPMSLHTVPSKYNVVVDNVVVDTGGGSTGGGSTGGGSTGGSGDMLYSVPQTQNPAASPKGVRK